MTVVSAMIVVAEGKGSTPHFLAYRQATAPLVPGRDVNRGQEPA